MDKYIFLDIDGVLNSNDFFVALSDESTLEIDPATITRLRRIIEATGAKIILSSSWKTHRNYQEVLRRAGYPIDELPIRDITPDLEECDCFKGMEIRRWLQDNLGFSPSSEDPGSLEAQCQNSDLHSFCIFDDENDMLYEHRHQFIHTSKEHGLLDQHVEEAIRILNTPIWEFFR